MRVVRVKSQRIKPKGSRKGRVGLVMGVSGWLKRLVGVEKGGGWLRFA